MDDEPPFGRPQENQGNERSGRQRSEERLSSLLLLYDLVILSKRLMMGAGKWDLTGRDGGPRGRASCLLRWREGGGERDPSSRRSFAPGSRNGILDRCPGGVDGRNIGVGVDISLVWTVQTIVRG